MALRFYRRVRLAKGVSLNFGKKGVSLSLGGRGFRTPIASRGTRTTIGIPGTGISYSKTHNSNNTPRNWSFISILVLFVVCLFAGAYHYNWLVGVSFLAILGIVFYSIVKWIRKLSRLQVQEISIVNEESIKQVPPKILGERTPEGRWKI